MNFHYFPLEQKWDRKGNKQEIEGKKNRAVTPDTTWGRQFNDKVCIIIQDKILCGFFFFVSSL